MQEVTIYHNPNCGTSRNVLAMLNHAGIKPKVIFYLETPPTETELKQLIADMGVRTRDILRTNVPPYKTFHLDDESKTDQDIIQAMLSEPILINRPIVVTSKGTRLCRPSEVLLDILPTPLPSPFTKEDGEVVEPK